MGGYENIMSNKGVSVLGGAKVGGCVMLSRRNAAQAANRFATFVGGLFQYAICRGCNAVCDLGSNDTLRSFPNWSSRPRTSYVATRFATWVR